MHAMMQSCFLALRDYWHERLLSACAILGLAAVLAPLLVLLGVHHGIITAMTERLKNDPRTLEITPVGSGKYGPEWFKELAALPGVAFVTPQTRSIAATINLRTLEAEGYTQATTPVIPSAVGDPLLVHWGIAAPGWVVPSGASANGEKGMTAAVVLSASTARKLQAKEGSLLVGQVDRMRGGKRESAKIPLQVTAVLPLEAQTTDMVYVPLELLVAAEDYRDGKAVPFLEWPGEDNTPPVPQESSGNGAKGNSGGNVSAEYAAYSNAIKNGRVYASFRLYGKALDDVEPLRLFFVSRNVEVYVKSAEIETVKSLDRAFTIVFGLITGAAMFGFMASTASSALAGVKRKSRALGLMRLMGFPRGGMVLFPVMQTMTTGLFGSLLAYALYLGVAFSIDSLFASALPAGQAVCTLPWHYVAAVCGIVLALSALSSLSAAWQVTTIEPSEVIRDV